MPSSMGVSSHVEPRQSPSSSSFTLSPNWAAGVISVCGGCIYGYNTGIIGGLSKPLITQFFPDSSNSSLLQGVLTAEILIGGLIGSFVGVPLTLRYGRRFLMRLIGVLCIVAALGMSLLGPSSFAVLVTARTIMGLAVGFAGCVCPMYCSEMADEQISGRMGTVFQIAICGSILLAQVVNYAVYPNDVDDKTLLANWQWQLQLGMGGIPGCFLLVLTAIVPEKREEALSPSLSPSSSSAHVVGGVPRAASSSSSSSKQGANKSKSKSKKGAIERYIEGAEREENDDENDSKHSKLQPGFEHSLDYEDSDEDNDDVNDVKKVKGGNTVGSVNGLAGLTASTSSKARLSHSSSTSSVTLMSVPTASGWRELFSKRGAHSVFIAVVLAMAAQLTGINAIIFYAPTILKDAGLQNVLVITIGLVGAWNLCAVFISFALVDKLGRRPLMLVALFFMSLGTGVLALTYKFFPESKGVVAIIVVVVFLGAFECGPGPLFFLMASESFPESHCEEGLSFANALAWVFNIIIAFGFPVLNDAGGPAVVFFLFAIVGVISGTLIFFALPETKKSVTEQQVAVGAAGAGADYDEQVATGLGGPQNAEREQGAGAGAGAVIVIDGASSSSSGLGESLLPKSSSTGATHVDGQDGEHKPIRKVRSIPYFPRM